MKKGNVITISDVAEALGVSKTTVSRAISGKGRIGEATRQKVLAYIEEHDYKPNVIARGLAQSKTFNLCVVMPEDYALVDLPFFQEVITGIQEIAGMNEYDILLCICQENDITSLERIVRNRKVDGIVLLRTFLKDAQFVGGCIAGGRRYLHINAKGDVEPCVFIHYSNANIHDCSLLDALKSPLFQAYHDNQPFNDNMLRPCPMLENPDKLGEMVKESKAVNTDYQSPETPEHLKEKAAPYAENWTPTAEKLWNKEKEKIAAGKAGVEQ